MIISGYADADKLDRCQSGQKKWRLQQEPKIKEA
jgi:hypothetical protein